MCLCVMLAYCGYTYKRIQLVFGVRIITVGGLCYYEFIDLKQVFKTSKNCIYYWYSWTELSVTALAVLDNHNSDICCIRVNLRN